MDKETINMKTTLLKMFLEIMHKYCAEQSRAFLKGRKNINRTFLKGTGNINSVNGFCFVKWYFCDPPMIYGSFPAHLTSSIKTGKFRFFLPFLPNLFIKYQENLSFSSGERVYRLISIYLREKMLEYALKIFEDIRISPEISLLEEHFCYPLRQDLWIIF